MVLLESGLKRQINCSTKGEPHNKRQRKAEIMPGRPKCKPNNYCETAPVYCHGMAKEYKTRFPGWLTSGIPTETYQTGSEPTLFCASSISSMHEKAEKISNKRFPDSSTSVLREKTNHHHGSEIYNLFSAPSFNNKKAPANSHGNAKDWITKYPVSSSSGLSNETYPYGSEIHMQIRATCGINMNAKKVSDTSSTALSSSDFLKETHHHGTEIQSIQFRAPSLHHEMALANSHGNQNWKMKFPGLLSALWKEPCHHESEISTQFHAPSFHDGAHNHGSDIHYTQIHAPSFHHGTARVNNIPWKAKKMRNRRFPCSSPSSGLLKEIRYHEEDSSHAQYRAPSLNHETSQTNNHSREIVHGRYHANSNRKAKKARYTTFLGS